MFHGPTFAFKDVALQFLGNLFEYFLKRRNANKKEGEDREAITIVGATSGDTGRSVESASVTAREAVKGSGSGGYEEKAGRRV